MFILTGTFVIFFTFLAINNALKIAISGVSSVFIGIGENSFSAFNTYEKDERKLTVKLRHAVKLTALSQ